MLKLHLGCGPHHLDGWINIDNRAYAGVERQIDVRQGLPFDDVAFIFAEHFIEHLDYRDTEALLKECRRVLTDQGVLRLSTPNLDWVWATHYRRELRPEEEILACFGINRAFRGWGHQFLYNFGTLTAALHAAGFSEVVRRNYGESPIPELHGLERHEQNPDAEGLSHILIVEASGRGGGTKAEFASAREMFVEALDLS